MRILGLDYGTKRVGVALSDESAQVAFPQAVWANDGKLLGKIKALCDEKKVNEVVLGDTLSYRGEANEITAQVNKFKLKLEQTLNLPVIFVSEIFSSREANRVVEKDAETDARAAALILQSYLDKRNPK
ncbi:MAG: Holliday junction resolvase RuvX [Patescibacteria group bacterium]